MKRLLIILLLLTVIPVLCRAQDSISTTNVNTVRYRGRTSVPSASTVGNAVCYFDKTAGKIKCSQNGGAFADVSSSGLTVGTTTITSGTTTRVIYDNAGVVGEYAISGTGSVAMTTSPGFTTPTLGVATATSLNGLTVTTSTGTLTIQNGVTVNSGAVGGTLGTGAFQPTGATLALDNLASVSINASLLFQTTLDLGSTTKPAHDLYLHGAGTYGTNYFKLTGTPTAARVVTLPDLASYTVAQITNGQTFAGVQQFATLYFNTSTDYGRLGQPLQINISNNYGGMALNTWSGTQAQAPLLEFNHSASNTIGTQTSVSNGGAAGTITFRVSDGAAFQNVAAIEAFVDAASGTNDTPGRLVFSTTPDGSTAYATRMTINNAGAVIIATATDATTTTSGAFQLAGGMAVRKRVFIDGITASSGLQTAVLCQSSGGEMIADSVACLASSARFKENVRPLAAGLDEVMRLRPVSYRYKREGIFAKNSNFQRERVGFIAEDVALVDTRFVGYEADGLTPRTVGYDTMVPLLVKAIQELHLEVERLKSDLRLLGQKR